MARRSQILRAGIAEASRVHTQLEQRRRAIAQGGWVDVFSMIVELKVEVLFQPLDRLLGAFFPGEEPGILINNHRPLAMQRFTAAHELGHYRMGHSPSLDDEGVLRRSPLGGGAGVDQQEDEANAFASELLLPRWLIRHHQEVQKWTNRDFERPEVTYQFALRVGASYEAACYGLQRHRVISRDRREYLQSIDVRAIKESLVQGWRPENWRRDIWVVTERDAGSILHGSQHDVVIVRVPEHANGGYLWNFAELEAAGFTIVSDARAVEDEEAVGGIVTRSIIAAGDRPVSGPASLEERRPWKRQGPPRATLCLTFDLTGPQSDRLLPVLRQQVLEAA